MNNPESQVIIARFYEAINTLINLGTLKSKRAFALEHNIEYTSFSRCEHELGSDRFQVDWIKYLYTEYPVSIDWLLTGRGGMLRKVDHQIQNEPDKTT